jgi:ferredoxin
MDLRQGRETVTQNIEWVLKTGVQSKPRKSVPVLQAEKRKGFAEVELGFDEETALEEARRCLSCGKCSKACPYGALSIGNNGGINKCTLCVDRIDVGLKPACLSVCPGKALHFGNLNDAESEVAEKIKAAGTKVYTLMDKGAHPSIRYILRRAEWREDIKCYNYQLDPIEGAGKFNG